MAKNVSSSNKEIVNLVEGFQNTSINVKFWGWHLMAPKIYFMKKVAAKGKDWSYIGVERSKLAEIG